ncbi:hypothetical protein N646_4611 [Vibrio alginolyticus NBRC 15630 = ATCC 17749]|uniref:Uncharacterized protein n=1 Tax=Vibrio alginolyticus (strain ATCC 17749 / DSM 2171 / NBRC 15630 / NCIMB 1903 / NCTC 12160 / XII-53) TaxID=1219076 RepID=A0A2I3CTB8_VIBAX|nr:hypothetical protein N646_4611 [Vibrio alginolyticus NBRC 15630 = ATCC 17749]
MYANWPQRKQRNVIVNAYHVTLTKTLRLEDGLKHQLN